MNKCRRCGSEAELDWNGLDEFSYGAWQECHIWCLKDKCWNSVSVDYPDDDGRDTSEKEAIVVEFWNKANPVSTNE